MFIEQILAEPVPNPRPCARYSGWNKPVWACKETMTLWFEGRLWYQIQLSARLSSASYKVCHFGHVTEPLEALNSPSSRQSSCEDQRGWLCQEHKHSTWHRASTQHTASVIITKEHFCVSLSHLSFAYSAGLVLFSQTCGWGWKLIRIVQQHHQWEIKLRFKSECRVLSKVL